MIHQAERVGQRSPFKRTTDDADERLRAAAGQAITFRSVALLFAARAFISLAQYVEARR